MLVPDTPTLATSVIDVRDLAGWLLDRAREGTTGVYDTVGPVVPFADWVALSRQVGGHRGPLAAAPADWLLEQGVNEYMARSPWRCGWSRRAPRAGPPGPEPLPSPMACSTARERHCWTTY